MVFKSFVYILKIFISVTMDLLKHKVTVRLIIDQCKELSSH